VVTSTGGRSSLKGAGLSSGCPARRAGPLACGGLPTGAGWLGSGRAPATIRGQGGAPAAERGRTTLTPVRSGAYCAREASPVDGSARWSPSGCGGGRVRISSKSSSRSSRSAGPVLGCQSSLRRATAAWSDPAAAGWAQSRGRPPSGVRLPYELAVGCVREHVTARRPRSGSGSRRLAGRRTPTSRFCGQPRSGR